MQFAKEPLATDLNRWRLKVDGNGAQTWVYLETEEEAKAWPQSICDKYWIGLPLDVDTLPQAKTPMDSVRNCFEFYKHLQTEDGHWAGEYGGPMFLLPGIVFSMYITGIPIPERQKQEYIRYLINRAHIEDGGWGIHIEGHSTVFGTALNYVALRILGVDSEHPTMVKSRNCLHKLGSATAAPSWGKFWLALLGVYDWEGLNPVPPELWVLPKALPVHPGKFWVHTRAVYLPMSYIYGKRITGKETELVLQLRKELYTQTYETIDWPKQRNNISEADLYSPHSKTYELLMSAVDIYQKLPNYYLREYSLKKAYEQIIIEDENTYYLGIAPVSKPMNMICRWFTEGPDSEAFRKHASRLDEFLWLGREGMMVNGTNGSQLWDTAFCIQAIAESGLAQYPENRESIENALRFLDNCQIRRNVPNHEYCFRQVSNGAWPFSTREQGYTVSDCTAEGLKAALLIQGIKGVETRIAKERLYDAVDVLLTMQNEDGGFASYERIRGPQWLEWINPAEVFGKIMIEYSYPECTTSVLLGLSTFQEYYPEYRKEEIEETKRKSIEYIFKSQKKDGSWFGSWGICFTYAMMFALESLAIVGYKYKNCAAVKKACEFLVSKQQLDGGWGETFKSCETGVYHQNQNSQVVNTAWALMALLSADYPDEAVIRRGVKLIMSRQQPNGEWLQENIEGVFNKNCMISYPNFKFIFTMWALGRYAIKYDNPELL
ncbi:Lanosterol synthase (Oxidosqualene--lanosterol cyclase) [Basidiobolus ranarum]|uniref:Terpene cyclase/mutase family member n=1 Tax=Basidiobolus ranarum TaxID=34480 RepID=A0ABR2WRR8_9FUNG